MTLTGPALDTFLVDEDYLENMQLKLLAGTSFQEANGEANKNFVIINEQAVKDLHFSSAMDAVNEEIILQYDSTRKTIIGVVKDYNHRDLFRVITPMALMYDPTQFNLLQVSYAGTYENAIKSIEKAWASCQSRIEDRLQAS